MNRTDERERDEMEFPSVVENIRRGAQRTADRLGVSVNDVLWSLWQCGTISAAEFVEADR